VVMRLQATTEDENLRLIQSLVEAVNAPEPLAASAAARPFAWALSISRARMAELRHRIDLHADSPTEQSRNVELAQGARRLARGILWKLAVENDATLAEPVLFAPGAGPRVFWAGLQMNAGLLEAPIEFGYWRVRGDSLERHQVAVWDRPSTCVAHALDLLWTDYRGLRSRVRACPYQPRGRFSDVQWNAEKLMSDPNLHFFVDDRFEKGQPQLYCTTQHRQTAYMREHRRRLADHAKALIKTTRARRVK
jgi:hypothetical protein